MKKSAVRIFSIVTICVVLLTTIAVVCILVFAPKSGTNPLQTNKSSYSMSYKELSEKSNRSSKWREGMVSGNGLQGFVTSGAPYSDTFIYQNIHFILPNKNARVNPISYQDLDYVRQSIVNSKDIVDEQSYDDVYTYHAGATLRIKQSKQYIGVKPLVPVPS